MSEEYVIAKKSEITSIANSIRTEGGGTEALSLRGMGSAIASINVQSDWEQEDSSAKDFIKNKPPKIDDIDMVEMLTEIGSIRPVSNKENVFYGISNNKIFVI